MGKKIFKFLCFGVAWGCVSFVSLCLLADIAGWDEMIQSLFDRLMLNALGTIAIGVGFGTTPIVYTFDRLRLWQQIAIHFFVGMGVLLPIAFSLGWIPIDSVATVVSFLFIYIILFFIFWCGFYFYHKSESKKINAKLKEMDNKKNKGKVSNA